MDPTDALKALRLDDRYTYGDSPEEIAHDNNRRATFALEGVVSYASITRCESEEVPTIITDMLCDLHHLCDFLGVEFEALLRTADVHYQAEIRGEL